MGTRVLPELELLLNRLEQNFQEILYRLLDDPNETDLRRDVERFVLSAWRKSLRYFRQFYGRVSPPSQFSDLYETVYVFSSSPPESLPLLDDRDFLRRVSKRTMEMVQGSVYAKEVENLLDKIRNDPEWLTLSPYERIRRLKKERSLIHSEAERVSRTTVMTVWNESLLHHMRKAGVLYAQYVFVLDDRTSRICRALRDILRTQSFPVESIVLPPFHPHCRTIVVPQRDPPRHEIQLSVESVLGILPKGWTVRSSRAVYEGRGLSRAEKVYYRLRNREYPAQRDLARAALALRRKFRGIFQRIVGAGALDVDLSREYRIDYLEALEEFLKEGVLSEEERWNGEVTFRCADWTSKEQDESLRKGIQVAFEALYRFMGRCIYKGVMNSRAFDFVVLDTEHQGFYDPKEDVVVLNKQAGRSLSQLSAFFGRDLTREDLYTILSSEGVQVLLHEMTHQILHQASERGNPSLEVYAWLLWGSRSKPVPLDWLSTEDSVGVQFVGFLPYAGRLYSRGETEIFSVLSESLLSGQGLGLDEVPEGVLAMWLDLWGGYQLYHASEEDFNFADWVRSYIRGSRITLWRNVEELKKMSQRLWGSHLDEAISRYGKPWKGD